MIQVLPETLVYQAKQERLQMMRYEQLAAIAKSAANAGRGSYYNVSYDDIMNPKPVDTRTPEEIVKDVISRGGLEVIE